MNRLPPDEPFDFELAESSWRSSWAGTGAEGKNGYNGSEIKDYDADGDAGDGDDDDTNEGDSNDDKGNDDDGVYDGDDNKWC